MNNRVRGDLLSRYRKAAATVRKKEQLVRLVAAKAVRRRKVLEEQLGIVER